MEIVHIDDHGSDDLDETELEQRGRFGSRKVDGQIRKVVVAAERAAEEIRHDAQLQARRHLAEAHEKADRLTAERVRLTSELTSDLARRSAAIKSHSDEISTALSTAAAEVGISAGLTEARPSHADPARAADEPRRRRPGSSRRLGRPLRPSKAMLLRATALAVAGGDREDIATALAAEFDEDPELALSIVLPRPE